MLGKTMTRKGEFLKNGNNVKGREIVKSEGLALITVHVSGDTYMSGPFIALTGGRVALAALRLRVTSYEYKNL